MHCKHSTVFRQLALTAALTLCLSLVCCGEKKDDNSTEYQPEDSINRIDMQAVEPAVKTALITHIGDMAEVYSTVELYPVNMRAGVKLYFAKIERMGGPSSVAFVDRDTGRVIETDSNLLSRPGAGFVVEFRDLTCDGADEVVLKYGGGGTISHDGWLAILSYQNNKIVTIFEHPIFIFPEEMDYQRGDAYSITLQYRAEPCDSRVRIQPGLMGTKNAYLENPVTPIADATTEVYVYDAAERRFRCQIANGCPSAAHHGQ